MTVIVTTSPGFGKHGQVTETLARLGWSLVRCNTAAEVAKHIADADFLVAGLLHVDAATLAAGARLKGVLKHGVGTDNIDMAACTAAGLPVCNTPGANANAVAELAIGLIFAMSRSIPESHADIRAGRWNRLVGQEVAGKVLGILGLGNIGRCLATKASALGMEVIATDPHAPATNGVRMVDFDTLLATSDHLSLHVGGNAALLTADRIAQMKPGATLLNLARGEVADLDAVAAALESGHLGGAAIDAYVTEPPDFDHPVFRHPRAVFMPHSGADTLQAMENVGLMNIADMQTLLSCGRPERTLNPVVFQTA